MNSKCVDINYNSHDYSIQFILDSFLFEHQSSNRKWKRVEVDYLESILLQFPQLPLLMRKVYNTYDFLGFELLTNEFKILSLYKFIKLNIKLSGFKICTQLNGKRFSDLSPKTQRRILNTVTRCYSITNYEAMKDNEEIKFLIKYFS